MSPNPLPRQFAILREQFNADIREATKDGMTDVSLFALAGAIAEDLIMAIPPGAMRALAAKSVAELLVAHVEERTRAGE